ncbi:hypothetical protein VTN77DRAFT_7273 [Rasamsonia byssochlamydoides]|uniref:uncharacterized protein n=1 Tax=Rasamsonia byssochlamydoides TaxID=89139 RepID=UPI003743722C
MQKEWIQEYDDEERRSFAILQREVRIAEEKRALLKADDKFAALKKCDEELIELREQYSVHRQALRRLAAEKPKGAWIRQWDLKRRRKRNHMTLAWIEESKLCALGGGCCERGCGCCQRPLKTVLEPNNSNKKKKTKRIYGHCTKECGCCIRAVCEVGSESSRSRA